MSPVRLRPDYQGATARLAPLLRFCREEFKLSEEARFVGDCVMRSLVGLPIEDLVIYDPYLNFKQEMFHKYTTDYGTFNISINQPVVRYWDYDGVFFRLYGGKVFFNSAAVINDIFTSQQIHLYNNLSEPEKAFELGLKYIADTGWRISPDSMATIQRAFEKNKPLQEYNETILGFRAYNISSQGYLTGAQGVIWETPKLTVDCPQFREHIQDSESTVGGGARNDSGQNVHGCGIYMYKDPTECVIYYGVGNKMHAIAAVVGWGDFWEGERGYRIEHARIEKLWVLGQRPLRPYKINGGVVMDCKIQDFFKDIYSTGLEFDSSRSLK